MKEEKEKKKKIKKEIPDTLAANIIMAAVAITIILVIGIYMVMAHFETKATSGNLGVENISKNEVGSIENLTSVENINSIEELQKLNEKEIEKAEKEEKKKQQNQSSTPKYYIKVNYGAQVVTIYTKDSKGNYTVPVKAMVCSTGTYTPTSGVYKIPAKIRWCHMIGDVWGQYCSQVVGDILFHSVPYATKGDHSSLLYNKYDQLGTKASLGCIRLTCRDAKWIYDNCKIGTQVEFYSSSNPGPLGKPSARKISNAPSNIRGWDPTDPAKGNPWPEYLANSGKNEKPNQNKVPEQTTNVIVNEIKPDPIPDDEPDVNDTIIDDTIGGESQAPSGNDKENQGSEGSGSTTEDEGDTDTENIPNS